jgi:hypothetical protein
MLQSGCELDFSFWAGFSCLRNEGATRSCPDLALQPEISTGCSAAVLATSVFTFHEALGCRTCDSFASAPGTSESLCCKCQRVSHLGDFSGCNTKKPQCNGCCAPSQAIQGIRKAVEIRDFGRRLDNGRSGEICTRFGRNFGKAFNLRIGAS